MDIQRTSCNALSKSTITDFKLVLSPEATIPKIYKSLFTTAQLKSVIIADSADAFAYSNVMFFYDYPFDEALLENRMIENFIVFHDYPNGVHYRFAKYASSWFCNIYDFNNLTVMEHNGDCCNSITRERICGENNIRDELAKLIVNSNTGFTSQAYNKYNNDPHKHCKCALKNGISITDEPFDSKQLIYKMITDESNCLWTGSLQSQWCSKCIDNKRILTVCKYKRNLYPLFNCNFKNALTIDCDNCDQCNPDYLEFYNNSTDLLSHVQGTNHTNYCYYCRLIRNIDGVHNKNNNDWGYQRQSIIIPMVDMTCSDNIHHLSHLFEHNKIKLILNMYLKLDAILKPTDGIITYKNTIAQIKLDKRKPIVNRIYKTLYKNIKSIVTCRENIYHIPQHQIDCIGWYNAQYIDQFISRYEILINKNNITADPNIYKFAIILKFMQSPISSIANIKYYIANDLYDYEADKFHIEIGSAPAMRSIARRSIRVPDRNAILMSPYPPSPRSRYLFFCCCVIRFEDDIISEVELNWILYLIFINADDLYNFFDNIKSDKLFYKRYTNGTKLEQIDLMPRLASIKDEILQFKTRKN